MSDTRDPQAVIAEAEQAANAGDFPAAERLLLEAANLQEASLGPAHPDLANTYNNLGVVYEITGKPADAELSFRRAYKIATVAFPAHHPFVATSRKNLEDFCAARGIAVDPPAPAPALSPVAHRAASAANSRGSRNHPGSGPAAEGCGARCEASAGSAGSGSSSGYPRPSPITSEAANRRRGR